MNNSLKLYLPFDQLEYGMTGDFSENQNHATVTGAAGLTTENVVRGAAMELNGATLETDYDIPYSRDFTISCWVKPKQSQIGWLLNFSGIDEYLEQWLDVEPDRWYFFAFVRSGSTFLVYRDQYLVSFNEITENPIGFSFNEPGFQESEATIDELRVYEEALSAIEIIKLSKNMGTDVEYYINGINFKSLGVYVSASTGLVGQLEKKEGLTVNWDTYHGKVRDKKNPRYKERKIVLDCFIEAHSRTDFVDKVNAFFAQFDGSGTQRLRVDYDGTSKPLVYEVYQSKSVDPAKTWGSYNNALMVGTFKLELTEDEPVKRVLRCTGSSVSFTFSSNKMLNVYWGDGTHTFGLSGQNQTASHVYSAPGQYDIIITGVIEDITSFSTSAIVIWNKLK